ncbi:hypothetical protein H5300_24460 [Vibrio sp. SG41-7]|uniref:hypothetical protein n=1 Tax=Vibrio sp. SG41-7 TaxID=2760973 RepID=UPI0015FEE794|nr:hypothetical protein [Vibrio sp. SG41-7]MBB1466370.1 hypothetical protein [Vibrio sp. SG41-7]
MKVSRVTLHDAQRRCCHGAVECKGDGHFPLFIRQYFNGEVEARPQYLSRLVPEHGNIDFKDNRVRLFL